jgi:hypothetical protein
MTSQQQPVFRMIKTTGAKGVRFRGELYYNMPLPPSESSKGVEVRQPQLPSMPEIRQRTMFEAEGKTVHEVVDSIVAQAHKVSVKEAEARGHSTGLRAGPGRPPVGSEPADGHLHMRVTMARKNAWVRAAKPKKLAEWVTEILDEAAKAAGFDAES